MIRRMNEKVCLQTGHTRGNGSGVNTDNVAYTLEAVNGGGMAVMDIFRLDPESSNSMKSSNPHSGCHRPHDVCEVRHGWQQHAVRDR